jgi:hypothetical protein
VVHGAVPFELGSDLLVNDRLVGHKPRLEIRVADDRRAQGLGGHVRNMTRAGAALALDQVKTAIFFGGGPNALLRALPPM